MNDVPRQPPRVFSGWRALQSLTPALEMLDANPDLVGDDIAIALASEAPDAPKLLDALVATILYRERWANVGKAHADKINTLAKRDEAAADKLRQLLCSVMQQLKLKNHRAPDGSAALVNREGRIIITCLDEIPDELKKTDTVTTPDKRAIAREFDAGRDVPGAERGNAYTTVKIN